MKGFNDIRYSAALELRPDAPEEDKKKFPALIKFFDEYQAANPRATPREVRRAAAKAFKINILAKSEYKK